MRTLFCSLLMAVLIAVAPTWAKENAPANGDLELARRLENAFVKVAAQASESVVVITTKQKIEPGTLTDEEEEWMDRFKGTPFEYFFRHQNPPAPRPRETEGQGSGLIIRRDGYILTNNHVVDSAEEITVRLKDGREFEAEIVGVDPAPVRRGDRPGTDIAVVKIKATDLPVAKLANSDEVRVGQWAIAIGAPYELDYSFTVGFISAKGRSVGGPHSVSVYEDYLQTDAAINPGNSGGPLCDIEGRVVGINTLISGLNRGIGFAIPVNLAMETADKIVKDGRVIRPWLGITIESLEENRELATNLTDGVVVKGIQPKTPAAASELKLADIIVGVDGVPVKSPRELQRQILRKPVGQKVTLEVVRDGKPVKVSIQTAEMSQPSAAAARKGTDQTKTESAFGLTVQTLTPDLAKQFDVAEGEGVVVTAVADGSLAEDAELQHGDVITEVDRQPVRTADDFKAAMAKADAKKGALIFLKRESAATFVVLKGK